jgi:hypothetical protein
MSTVKITYEYEVEVNGKPVNLPIENLVTNVRPVTEADINKRQDDKNNPTVITYLQDIIFISEKNKGIYDCKLIYGTTKPNYEKELELKRLIELFKNSREMNE